MQESVNEQKSARQTAGIGENLTKWELCGIMDLAELIKPSFQSLIIVEVYYETIFDNPILCGHALLRL